MSRNYDWHCLTVLRSEYTLFVAPQFIIPEISTWPCVILLKQTPLGILLWQKAEKEKVTEHTWMSMRNHYRWTLVKWDEQLITATIANFYLYPLDLFLVFRFFRNLYCILYIYNCKYHCKEYS